MYHTSFSGRLSRSLLALCLPAVMLLGLPQAFAQKNKHKEADKTDTERVDGFYFYKNGPHARHFAFNLKPNDPRFKQLDSLQHQIEVLQDSLFGWQGHGEMFAFGKQHLRHMRDFRNFPMPDVPERPEMPEAPEAAEAPHREEQNLDFRFNGEEPFKMRFFGPAEEADALPELSYSVNPKTINLHFKVPEGSGSTSIRLLTPNGALVFAENITAEVYDRQLDRSTFKPGTYLLEVCRGEKHVRQRIAI